MVYRFKSGTEARAGADAGNVRITVLRWATPQPVITFDKSLEYPVTRIPGLDTTPFDRFRRCSPPMHPRTAGPCSAAAAWGEKLANNWNVQRLSLE